MPTNLYVLLVGFYDDFDIIGVFDTEEDAQEQLEKYKDKHNITCASGRWFKIKKTKHYRTEKDIQLDWFSCPKI